MKITKSELKEMIREALREELNKTNLNESLSSKFSIDGFDHEIVDTFEDDGHTGYDIVYAKNGTELVEVEIWDDDSPVTVVENLYSNNLFQRVYDSFDGFAADLTHKASRLRGITEGAMNGGQAEGGFLDTAKRPGGTTSKIKFNDFEGKKTKKVLAKDLKPGMVTDTGEVKQVTDRGNEIEVSYGGIGNRGSYASDNVAKDHEYEVLDECIEEELENIFEGIFDSKETKQKAYAKIIQDAFKKAPAAVAAEVASKAVGAVEETNDCLDDDNSSTLWKKATSNSIPFTRSIGKTLIVSLEDRVAPLLQSTTSIDSSSKVSNERNSSVSRAAAFTSDTKTAIDGTKPYLAFTSSMRSTSHSAFSISESELNHNGFGTTSFVSSRYDL
jgi:hypothetical protein